MLVSQRLCLYLDWISIHLFYQKTHFTLVLTFSHKQSNFNKIQYKKKSHFQIKPISFRILLPLLIIFNFSKLITMHKLSFNFGHCVWKNYYIEERVDWRVAWRSQVKQQFIITHQFSNPCPKCHLETHTNRSK